MSLAIIVAILNKLSDYVIPSSLVRRQFGYLYHYNKNVKDAKEEVGKLKSKRDRVEGSLETARRNGEIIETDVQNWLAKVNEVAEQVDKLLEGEAGDNKKCLEVWCINLCQSYQLSKEAKKQLKTLTKLLQEGVFNQVSRRAPHPGIASTSAASAKGLESRISLMEDMMKALKDDEVKVIGIHGLGGVGKTTLVKEVGRRAKAEMLFDEVAMAVVSRTPNVRKIQGEIADFLGLKFYEETELGRAGRLHARLEDERILLILDDVWAGLDLESVGVPSGKGLDACKIFLVSRNQDVCSEMQTEKEFLVTVLPEEEAWNLFREIVGDFIDSNDLRPIATQVVKECGGLPIAIVTVGNALKKKSIHGWKDAAKQLGKSVPKNIKGMHTNVYSNIELSYNSLESEEAKSCFLLCCLYPENFDIQIEHLVRYGMALRLFENVDTLEDSRNRVNSLIDDLKASRLLVDGKFIGFVKMHDVVRDVAIYIASKDKLYMVKAGVRLKEWPKDTLEPYTGISLMFNDFNKLPERLKCPKLQLLSLSGNHDSLKIPSSFFEGTEELKLLDLSNILSLPSSLQPLSNLRKICLKHCNLGDVSVLGELKTLEILSFANSNIKELPRQIGQLTHLRLLDLDSCNELRVIRYGVISSLTQLEELYMRGSFEEWDIEEGEGNERTNASLIELQSLSRLITLDIHIANSKFFAQGLFRNLSRYRISIGNDFNEGATYQFSKILKLKMGFPFGNVISMLVRESEDLYIKEMKGLKNVLFELDYMGFRFLKCLKVQSSDEMEYLVNIKKLDRHVAFPSLEKLYIISLPNLKKICCHGQLPVGSFYKLSVMEVSHCPSLDTIFDLTGLLIEEGHPLPLSNIRELRLSDLPAVEQIWKGPTCLASLQNLTTVVVERCERLNFLLPSIIFQSEREGEGEFMDEIVLPQLNSLKLKSLPDLKSFWCNTSSLTSQGDLDTYIHQPLFNQKVKFPSLEELELIFMVNLKEIWHVQLPPTSFCKLRTLVVSGCSKLLKFAHSSLLKRLQNLVKLEVRGCDSLKEVFDIEGLDVEGEAGDGPLSQLRELKLANLPILEHIWSKGFQKTPSLQNLRSLILRNCGCQGNLFSSCVSRSLQQLREIRITECMHVEGIFAEENEAMTEESVNKIVFPQVSSLILESLPNLISFSKGNFTLEWPSLKILRIVKCHKFEAFTSTELNLNTPLQRIFDEKVALPRLEQLTLHYMDNLVRVWHGPLPALSFGKLLKLEVVQLEKLLNVFPSNMLQRLKYLEELVVEECSSLEVVFDIEGLAFEEEYAAPLSRLFLMKLNRLPRLMHLWNKNPKGILDFQDLNGLEVYHCANLRNLLSPSVAKGLVQLEMLEVSECEMMEEIIAKEQEDEVIDCIVFPRVVSLKLKELPKLMRFSGANCTLQWPSLEKLIVQNCSQIKKFSGAFIAEKLTAIDEGIDETTGGGDLDIHTQHLFDGKDAFPSLLEFELSFAVNLRKIWHGQLLDGSFSKLKDLKVNNCDQLLNVVPSNLLQRLQNLEILQISECASLLEVFDVEGLHVEEGHVKLSQLRELKLSYLRNLKCICNKDPQGFLGFQSLSMVQIENCDGLRSLFSPSVARCLVQLQSLSISGCKSMEEIVTNEEETENQKIVFPHLESLVLEDLPNLKSFGPGSCEFEWPSLKTLTIGKCPQLKTFLSLRAMHVGFKEICEADRDLSVQNLFNEMVAFPSLEDITLSSLNLKDICHGLPPASLCKLCVLEVEKCDNLLNVITFSILQRLQSLQTFTVRQCGSLEVVFDLGGFVFEERHATLLPMLQELRLIKLPALTHILKKDPEGNLIFQNLIVLKVHGCDNLTNLFSIPVGKGLVQLQKIDIRRCEKMEVIITEGSDGEDDIVDMSIFPRLDSLMLMKLPNLASFWPHGYTFELPSLNGMWVSDCPKIQTFISSFQSVQNLRKVHHERDKWLWTSDRNHTLECFEGQRPDIHMELVKC